MKFKDLNLNKKILENLSKNGYEEPTPIQQQVIPACLNGKDIFGCAQTGTGKTASFALPIINMLAENPRKREDEIIIKHLVLTPTRELAMQVFDNFKKYGSGLYQRYACFYGGESKRFNIKTLKEGVDVAICTPGRLLDLVKSRYMNISNVNTIVLDEADLMLDMGFISDVKKIISFLPTDHQTLFFSATMPKAIKSLVDKIMKPNYENIITSPPSSTIDSIDQKGYCVEKRHKRELLLKLINESNIDSAIIFVRTKIEADSIDRFLHDNKISSKSIHGDKEQRQRTRIIREFKERKIRILVATDVASRGIHVDNISHIINYDLPDSSETYVHRIGRTGRAKSKGNAFSIFTSADKGKIADIQKTTGKSILCFNVTPDTMELSPLVVENSERSTSGSSRNRSRRGNNRSSSSFSRDGNRRSYSGNRDGNKDNRSYSGNRDNRSYSGNRDNRSYSGNRDENRDSNSDSRDRKSYSGNRRSYSGNRDDDRRSYSGNRDNNRKSYSDNKGEGRKSDSGNRDRISNNKSDKPRNTKKINS
ncbi:MAG: DEAD/DEAH box helicase [Mycoplasmoidaceae bacterium]